ncbi:hypothetical protein EB230_21040 [Mesorhizobium sp. NZP2234]|nr:hypothetical protein EB230_21040 [Mesorhizobium sp. NZP2234]
MQAAVWRHRQVPNKELVPRADLSDYDAALGVASRNQLFSGSAGASRDKNQTSALWLQHLKVSPPTY